MLSAHWDDASEIRWQKYHSSCFQMSFNTKLYYTTFWCSTVRISSAEADKQQGEDTTVEFRN